MKKTFFIAVSIFTIAAILLSGCGNNPNPPTSATAGSYHGITGTITTGKNVTIASQRIPASGGNIAVTDKSSPINGLEIVVPAGAYAITTSFTISTAPINKHTFGKDFNPITPLISVNNGGAYADEIMSVTIPVQVPDDQFAMGFFYDADTKKLSGMNIISSDASSITLGTRHFSDFVISMIPKARLKPDIDSGFRPGIDDWQFPNMGSYIAPGGHCAGQSMTALWYYVTKPDGPEAALYARYDNNAKDPKTPSFWYDDSSGYRLASIVQKDIKWSSFENKFWLNLAGVNDETTYNLFAYAMQLTGEPQEVGIYSKAGGGHDMICYRIKDGKLYIADPNYPGDTGRYIKYDNKAFIPYNSAANAQDAAEGKGKSYEKIEYMAKTTTVDWKIIAQRWSEFKAGTIGSGIFPDYKLVCVTPDGDIQLQDGYVSTNPKIQFNLLSDKASGLGFIVYRDGKALKFDADKKYELQPGNNLLGFYIDGMVGRVWTYVDFRYFNIIYSEVSLTIEPKSIAGTVGQEYTFTARPSMPVKDPAYEWFINGKSMLKSEEAQFQTTFNEAGSYRVKVALLVDDKVLTTAEATVSIAQTETTPTTSQLNMLQILQQYTYLQGYVGFPATEHEIVADYQANTDTWLPVDTPSTSTVAGTYFPARNLTKEKILYALPITWNGTSFTGSYNTNIEKHTVAGTVSEDGTMIKYLEYSYEYEEPHPEQEQVNSGKIRVVLKDVPIRLDMINKKYFIGSCHTTDVQKYVAEYSYYKCLSFSNGFYRKNIINSEDILWGKGETPDNMWRYTLDIRFYLKDPGS